MYEDMIQILTSYPKHLDGKVCIQELKDNDYNWRQMEWAGWYNEYWMKKNLQLSEGNIYGKVRFDGLYHNFDIDYKAHNIDNAILLGNDLEATYKRIEKNGALYLLVKNNKYTMDESGDFKKWHNELKGKQTKYVHKNEANKRPSRMRKVSGEVQSICIYKITKEILDKNAKVFQKGCINSNGKIRKSKISLNLDHIEPEVVILI